MPNRKSTNHSTDRTGRRRDAWSGRRDRGSRASADRGKNLRAGARLVARRLVLAAGGRPARKAWAQGLRARPSPVSVNASIC